MEVEASEGIQLGIIFDELVGVNYARPGFYIVLLPGLVDLFYNTAYEVEFPVAGESLVIASRGWNPTLGVKSFKMTMGVQGGKVLMMISCSLARPLARCLAC